MTRTLMGLALLGAAAACATVGPEVEPYPTNPPEIGPAPSFDMPDPIERTLSNGLTVIYVPRGDLPLVQAVLVTRGGSMDDPADQPGLASFTAEMLDEGAGGLSALELAGQVEQLGASLSTGANWDGAEISLHVLRNELPAALDLMAAVTFQPDFPEAELQRIREERLTALASAKDQSGAIAANAFVTLVYGTGHPYGRVATQASVGGIDRDAVVEFHRRYYRPGASTLVLVGDVDPSMQSLVEEAFGSWDAGNVAKRTIPAPPTVGPTRLYLIDKPGAAQSTILIGHPGAARDTPDYYALQVLNTMLGGSFTSRLNQNLREDHGYTYGAGSGFSMRTGVGPFSASADVVTAKTDSAVIEFFRELHRIRDEPVPPDELERAKQYVALRLPQQLETNGQVAGTLASLVTFGLPLDYYDDYVDRIMAVTAEDVRAAAREYVRPDRSVVVVVGDQATIESGLRALDVGPVEVRQVGEFVR